ncbi:hypothetical protein RF11_15435 [Thelohanellus kitauei]|uniref:Uncharacterized protein n=1 Tax=Thelohanellus kitauei TaxID=669202 RepID=A0A0C2IGI9_THEKT|nr:hypothetical protein RF11_15435 [Thelohanellus kitauei]
MEAVGSSILCLYCVWDSINSDFDKKIEGDVVRHQNQLKPRMPFYSECQQEKTQLSYVPNYNNEDAPNVNTRPDPRRSAILEEKRLKKARGGEGIYILIRLKCAYSLFYSIVVDILATNF